MAYHPVDVAVLQKSTGQGVAGVVVAIYSADGKMLYDRQVTDERGRASYLLYAATYSLRLFKPGFSAKQPVQLVVTDGQDPNVSIPQGFSVEGDVMSRSVPRDPRFCRCYGVFLTQEGSPKRRLSLEFIGDYGAVLLEGNALLPERAVHYTDDDGVACVDLLRCAIYSAQVGGSHERKVYVPDAPEANLVDVLFPVVDTVTFPQEQVSLRVGEHLELSYTAYLSSGVKYEDYTGVLTWDIADSDVASITSSSKTICLYGRKRGSTEVTVRRNQPTITRIPDRSLMLPLQIAVI